MIGKGANAPLPIFFFFILFKKGLAYFMAIELKQLIDKVSNMDITLLAGQERIHNLVSWVHMVETMEASIFLEGGEIAFTTGLGLNSKVTLLMLTQNIYQNGAAGIIVNTGPFIESIPTETLDFCNKHNFPIFIIPWKIHLAEIMRIFCFMITKDDQRHLETSAAFKNAIFFPKQEELYVIPLSQREFQYNGQYCVIVIKLEHSKEDLPTRIESLTLNLDNYMRHKYSEFAIFSHDTEILAVVANYTEEKLHAFLSTLKTHCFRLLHEKEDIVIGVGKVTNSIRCLYKSYSQASSIQKLQSNHKIDPSLIYYSDMGIYKLLMGIEDQEILQEYYEKTLQPLLEYDKKTGSDLMQVLHIYLSHNGSVKETADEIYVHRNTVNYKIKKIEDILSIDLSSLTTRLQISIGFMLIDML